MTALYFDYCGRTPLLTDTASKLMQDLTDPMLQANPSAQHALGYYARDHIDASRTLLTQALQLPKDTIIFTASSTESIHLALLGAIEAYPRHQYTFVSWHQEHSATIGALKKAHDNYGAHTLWLDAPKGRIDCDMLEDTLKKNDVFMITFSIVQHELGIIQEWEKILELATHYGCLVHLDASQAIGKIPHIALHGADYITLSSHKCFGPSGIAALYVASSKRRTIHALLTGGGQQYNMRSGTEPAALIRAMANTYIAIHHNIDMWHAHATACHLRLKQAIIDLQITEHAIADLHRVPYIFSLHIPPSSQSFWESHIMSSQGSACGHKKGILSPTLRALGVDPEIIAHSYRISWCHMTSMQDIETLLEILHTIYDV